MKKSCLPIFAAFAVMGLSMGLPVAHGADGVLVQANVKAVLMNGRVNPDTGGYYWGGCMAWLTQDPATKANCNKDYVSFDCSGKLGTDQVLAYRLVDQAQLALAANKKVDIFFTDSKTVDGYCLAYRIDVFQ